MERKITHITQIQNFKRLIEHDESNQFQFVFQIPEDNSKKNFSHFEVNTTLNKARILSKKINDICLIDPTIDRFEIIYYKKNNNVKQLLEKMISSMGEEISIAADEFLDYFLLQILLGEENETIKLTKNSFITSIEDAISFLSTEFHENSIFYLATHFKEFLTNTSSDQISTEIIIEIIDAYFEFNKSEENEATFIFEELLKKDKPAKIVIHFLTRIEVSKMTSNMIDYIYDHLDDEILNNELLRIISIVREQYFQILNKSMNQLSQTVKKIEYEGNELKGIFSFLQNQDGGEFKSDTLKLLGGGTPNSLTNLLKYDPSNINKFYINYDDRDATEGEAWIEFDFCFKKVKLTSYTIRSDDWGPQSHHPMSWRFVGSNDRIHWIEIDKRTSSYELKGDYKQHRFICNSGNNNFYRYIKYIQDDNWCMNSRRYYNIDLTCIEFFGSIVASE